MKIGRKRIGDSLTELMNYEAVCRTAPATPGLLIILAYCVNNHKRNKPDETVKEVVEKRKLEQLKKME